MILCSLVAHASIFNTPRQAFFGLNQRVKLFCVIRKFLPVFLETFYLIRFCLSIQILTLEIQSFKPLRDTYECNN